MALLRRGSRDQPVLPPLYLNPYFIGASIFGLLRYSLEDTRLYLPVHESGSKGSTAILGIVWLHHGGHPRLKSLGGCGRWARAEVGWGR